MSGPSFPQHASARRAFKPSRRTSHSGSVIPSGGNGGNGGSHLAKASEIGISSPSHAVTQWNSRCSRDSLPFALMAILDVSCSTYCGLKLLTVGSVLSTITIPSSSLTGKLSWLNQVRRVFSHFSVESVGGYVSPVKSGRNVSHHS